MFQIGSNLNVQTPAHGTPVPLDVEHKEPIDYTDSVISSRSTLLQSIALALPVCFMWLFAICVANCSNHAESKTLCTALASEPCLSDPDESDCCPVAASPTVALPDRRLPSPGLRGAQQSATPSSILPLAFSVPCHAQRSIPNTSTGPPSKRLCALRI